MNDYERLKDFIKHYIKNNNFKMNTNIDNLVRKCFLVCELEHEDNHNNIDFDITVGYCINYIKTNGLYDLDYL